MALVFISCGQASDEERDTAQTVATWLRERGFDVYVAIQTQSLSDVNSGIIEHLTRADYYLFIDFARETLVRDGVAQGRRGSLFTHQELAISYLLQFRESVFLTQSDVELGGIARYLLTNATRFSRLTEVLPLVQRLVLDREWRPDYSRHLRCRHVRRIAQPIPFGNHRQYIFFAHITNQRPDLAAVGTVAAMEFYQAGNEGERISPYDRTRLKWAGHRDFSCFIFPQTEELIDLFAVRLSEPSRIYLHSEWDQSPRRPVIDGFGVYVLHYRLYAPGFPQERFRVRVELVPDVSQSSVTLLT